MYMMFFKTNTNYEDDTSFKWDYFLWVIVDIDPSRVLSGRKFLGALT